ncbi:nuclear transport factor 2 family protein [Hoeflea sp. WL0058]|uniref:Nuclear transport factor 2 family protein n=1 Tax=Flavimaribacter sediminis TaxID=2865987 RepID=A0AAE2ZJN4_9HYPH|nr:nuclear transport factor 2 family protein [Flavimaribacter sediminis]MBW8635563.1 nuclear transport factor 2 family protein [Flavimaribacter sediminis]
MKKTLTAAAVTALLATSALADDTTSIKPIVGKFLGAVLQGDVDTMRDLANVDYIQHNPFIPTGLEPFIGMLPVLQEAGTTAENIRMFEDGNYVFMHNIWRNAAPFGADTMVSFDIIRVDEKGKVAEHWDALQPLVSDTVSGRTQTDGPTEVTDLDQTEANKALAVALVQDVLMGRDPARITDYINAESYAQHNPMIADGLDGIMAAVETLTAQNNMFLYTEIHAVLGEGNFVLTVSEGQWNGTTNAFYDLFRMEDGMIVEHWDVIQPVPTEGLANTNGMFTGFDN